MGFRGRVIEGLRPRKGAKPFNGFRVHRVGMLCILFDNRVKLMLALLHNTPRQLSSSVINCCLPLFEHREPSVDEPPLFEGWRFPFVPVPVLLNLSYLKTIPFKNKNSIASSWKMQSKILHNFNKILFYLPSSLHCSSVIIHQISGFMLVNLARVRLHNAILRIESPRDCIPIKSWRVPIENCHHGETVHDDHYQRGLIKGPTVV